MTIRDKKQLLADIDGGTVILVAPDKTDGETIVEEAERITLEATPPAEQTHSQEAPKKKVKRPRIIRAEIMGRDHFIYGSSTYVDVGNEVFMRYCGSSNCKLSREEFNRHFEQALEAQRKNEAMMS
jgi:hypothetical protein